MKSLLKNLGLILIVIGALVLLSCAVLGDVNNNLLLSVSAILVVIGLISYIVINKLITD